MPDTARPQGDHAGDAAARERTIAEHLRLVRHVARRVHRTIGAEIELDELVSAGTLGLIDALDRFDPSRDLAFSTYAVPRIRGAILDELRRLDHAPSSVRRRARALGAARARLAGTLGRAPRSAETAGAMGIDLPTLWRWQADAEGTVRLALDRPVAGAANEAALADTLAAEGDDVEERLTRAAELRRLRDAILRLTSRERTVLALYYHEALKMAEIAQLLEVSESRISQVRSRAIEKLRRELRRAAARVA